MDEKISFIFTVRVDSDARFANIVATISYYSAMFPNAVLIVMEADANSKLCNVLPRVSGNIRYEFIQDNNPIFHRTHYINEEFRLTSTRYAVVVDSDIIVSKEQLVDAIEILKKK